MSAVHQSILGVMDDLSKVGIGKDRVNQQQHFQYRGIDDVRDAVAPLLVKNKLLILPKVISRDMTERESKNGGALFCVLLKLEYEFLSVEDGSTKTIGPLYAEAMDSGDKATNKAMSAAYKTLCIDTFCIRTKGDEVASDPDATVHEVVPQPEPPPPIQTQWDGSKKVGFTKQFRQARWDEVPEEFLDWCNNNHPRLNSLQRECAMLEIARRKRVVDELPKDLPESFYANGAAVPEKDAHGV
jgi:ERF superfamily